MSLQHEVNCLINAIQESSQYKNYKKTRLDLLQDEELTKKVNEFRKQRLLLESRTVANNYPANELKAVQELYSSLRSNYLASSFLDAERELTEMILNIYKEIGEALDFYLDFLNQ
ncbi:MAG: YlbF family regulator [Epulopiscium sp.]|jgi:cell fate (sporulation/competence/biofilm development) regulator YlbF (YheA/YmcA/DUF963 family)|nr:YlbF family regulator [Candidatus Epulonipiscium sp.]